MLPSGNDAAIVLAEHFGRYLMIEESRMTAKKLKEVVEQDPWESTNTKAYVKRFVKHMNLTAAKLKLNNSQFSNPHGLADKANKSSSEDITRLTLAAIKDPMFREIVSK